MRHLSDHGVALGLCTLDLREGVLVVYEEPEISPTERPEK